MFTWKNINYIAERVFGTGSFGVVFQEILGSNLVLMANSWHNILCGDCKGKAWRYSLKGCGCSSYLHKTLAKPE
ncbi:hypothetical protein MKW98_030924 [Papaver atlanticum]|uniref:Protein kinase domain-containing protein n=1 Tax=Papaver atlanticum TaxID=357466 RepID=A0AAD4XA62_9MAGN|nr:hypothetical protein MKW98_030924 [Papaver atlanticum]